jgi:Flp pilus assembly pilin Flp
MALITQRGIEIMKKTIRFFKDEKGATAVEYSIMLAAIAAVIISVVYAVGEKTLGSFTNFNSQW